MIAIRRFVALSLLLMPPLLQGATPWSFEVVAGHDLDAVDNIVVADDGVLYATLERRGGRGQLVRIARGVVQPLLGGLDRPDGLLRTGERLFITEESASGRILEYNLQNGRSRLLARLVRPEGIDRLPGGDLVISEDATRGRLLQLTAVGKKRVLVSGLNRPEGLCVHASGLIYVAVTGDNHLIEISPALSYRQRVVLSGLREPDQVACHGDGSVWISEDANPGRLLRYDPVSGSSTTILSGLNSPQGIAFARDGSVYLAEQGRGRILRLQQR